MKIKKNNKFAIVATISSILFLAGSAVFAQQPDFTQPGSYSIKTANGYLFIRNGVKKSLCFDVVGEKVEAKQEQENPTFLVDGQLIADLDGRSKTI